MNLRIIQHKHPILQSVAFLQGDIRTLRRFFEEIGMPTHLSQLGIKPENYEKLAANTVRTVNGPVKSYSPLDEKAIIEIYHLAE